MSKSRKQRDKSMSGFAGRSEFSNASVHTWIGNDFTCGNRGMAKAVRGAKKFVRSRIRFHDKAETRKLLKEYA